MDFGYLLLTVDMTAAQGTLTISFRSPSQLNEHDSVTVPLPVAHAAQPLRVASSSAGIAAPHRHGAAPPETRKRPPARR
jgi:hypothetical protein